MKNIKNIVVLLVLALMALWMLIFYGCSVKDSNNVATNNEQPQALAEADNTASAEADTSGIKKEENTEKLEFVLTDGDFSIKGKKGFDFDKSAMTPAMPYPITLENNVAKLADYLKANPQRQLVVTGRYQGDEENNTEFADLGLARGEQIKTQLLALGVDPQQLVVTSEKSSNAVLNDKNQYANMISLAMQDAPAATNGGFNVSFGDLSIATENGFNFARGEAVLLNGEDPTFKEEITKMVSYFQDKPHHQLTVIGGYRGDEVNNTPYPSLGFARAEQVKKYLISLGLDGKQIQIDNKLMPEMISNEKREYLGIIGFSIQELDDPAFNELKQKMSDLFTNLNENPLTLYFDTGATNLKLSNQERNYLLAIVTYLDYDSSAKVVITGYTDNTGNDEQNLKIGEGRAKFTADYLAKNSISAQQMVVYSKGSSDPIATNETEEGRALNRRVVISLQK